MGSRYTLNPRPKLNGDWFGLGMAVQTFSSKVVMSSAPSDEGNAHITRFRVRGSGLRGLGFWVQGLGFWVQGLGVQGFGLGS